MRAPMPRVSHLSTFSRPVVPWLVRAMATMPPYAVLLSATRRKYMVISTLRH